MKTLNLVSHYVLLSFLFVTISVPAQEAGRTDQRWSRVQALAAGTGIHVKANKDSANCKVKTVGADSLTCVWGSPENVRVFQLADIKSVKVVHTGRSTVAGMVPGGAILLAGVAGAAATRDNFSAIEWLAIAVLGLIVLLVGGLIGSLTDFSGTTIYRRG